MRTFFYMPRQLPCDDVCRWQRCPRRYLSMLLSVGGIQSIQVIDSTAEPSAHLPELAPQHGDIVIMYAGDAQDLELLRREAEFFEFTRNILVFGDSVKIDASVCHCLGPRFITQTDRNIDELGAVIQRMQDNHKRIDRMDQHGEVLQ